MVKKKKQIGGIILVTICVVGILVFCLYQNNSKNNEQEKIPVQLDEVKETSINLGYGMMIKEVGKYTGAFMEDGSDEMVSDVLMLTVKNEGDETIQYAEIALPIGEKEAKFSLSTLTPGSTMLLLEQNRMNYVDGEYNTAVAKNVVLFSEPLSLCEDKLKIQALEGVINVSNISGHNINGDIIIYYKNIVEDIFYGGITYRVRIEGGLKKNEIRQLVANHFSESGSKIMFVTCGGK
jgi:hypothetical protein